MFIVLRLGSGLARGAFVFRPHGIPLRYGGSVSGFEVAVKERLKILPAIENARAAAGADLDALNLILLGEGVHLRNADPQECGGLVASEDGLGFGNDVGSEGA